MDISPALCCCCFGCWDRGSKHSWMVRGQTLHFLSLRTMWLEKPQGEAEGHEWEGRCLDFFLCVSLSFSLLHLSCPSLFLKERCYKRVWQYTFPLSGLLIGQQHVGVQKCRFPSSSPPRPPPCLLFFTGPPWCHPAPWEWFWIELIYWWPLCLFFLPQLLAL